MTRGDRRWLFVFALLCAACGTDRAIDEDATPGTSATPVGETITASGDEPVDACTPAIHPGTMQPSGLESCAGGGYWNRVATVGCGSSHGVPAESTWGCDGGCTHFAIAGVCRLDNSEPFCHYDCQSDADCGDGAACICASDGLHAYNQCVFASCSVAADCASSECGVSIGVCGTVSGLACRQPTDDCRVDADCPLPHDVNGHACVYFGDRGFTCGDCGE